MIWKFGKNPTYDYVDDIVLVGGELFVGYCPRRKKIFSEFGGRKMIVTGADHVDTMKKILPGKEVLIQDTGKESLNSIWMR